MSFPGQLFFIHPCLSMQNERAVPALPCSGLEEELIDCSGGDVISLEAGIERKLEALMKV